MNPQLSWDLRAPALDALDRPLDLATATREALERRPSNTSCTPPADRAHPTARWSASGWAARTRCGAARTPATLARRGSPSPRRSIINIGMAYTAEVIDHFEHPRFAGELEGAAARVRASNPVC